MRPLVILAFLVFLPMLISDTSFYFPSEVKLKIKNFVETNSFAGAISVVRAGNTLHESYHGLADRKSGRLNNRLTSFRIGSITKELTATVALILNEQGQLDLNAPVSRYLPVPTKWENIKVFHLLSHSAGVENYSTYRKYKNINFRDAPPSQTNDLHKRQKSRLTKTTRQTL